MNWLFGLAIFLGWAVFVASIIGLYIVLHRPSSFKDGE